MSKENVLLFTQKDGEIPTREYSDMNRAELPLQNDNNQERGHIPAGKLGNLTHTFGRKFHKAIHYSSCKSNKLRCAIFTLSDQFVVLLPDLDVPAQRKIISILVLFSIFRKLRYK